MKLFVWNGNLATGAYHEDGGCGVIAETLDKAIALLEKQDNSKDNFYNFASAAKKTEVHAVVEVSVDEKPRIVWMYSGCDC